MAALTWVKLLEMGSCQRYAGQLKAAWQPVGWASGSCAADLVDPKMAQAKDCFSRFAAP
jgi:hypothetical protein